MTMEDIDARRSIAVAVIVGFGLLFAAVNLFDIYRDIAIQGDDPYFSLGENALPLLLNIGVLVVAYRLYRSEEDLDFVSTVSKWVVLSVVGLGAMTAWIYYFEDFEGPVESIILLARVSLMGTVVGIVIGAYSGRQRERRKELALENTKIEALFENGTDCIAEIQFRGGKPLIRSVNPAFERTFGFAASDVRGRSINDVIVPPEEGDGADILNEQVRAGRRVESKVRRQTADGTIRTFRVRTIPLRRNVSEADGYAVYTDITDQQRYTDRLDRLHEVTRELIEVEDTEGVAAVGVRAAAEILDLDACSIHLYNAERQAFEPVAATDGARDLFGEVAAAGRDQGIVGRVFAEGESVNVDDLREIDDPHDSGTSVRSVMVFPLAEHGVLIAGSVRPNRFDEGEYSLAQVLAANVESALDRAAREERLRRQNDRLDAFTSIVSHDLRNPLSVAQGYLELARNSDDGRERNSDDGRERNSDDGRERHFDEIESALERMEALIEELLTLARQGESIGETSETAVRTVARSAWNGVESGESRLEIETNLVIDADTDRVRQLFENLFRNSVEHGDGPVTVRVGSLEADEGFFVEDTGPGIPSENRERIFQYGYTTSEEGTGFGLAIIEEIADSHGWRLDVAAGDAGGARFEFRI